MSAEQAILACEQTALQMLASGARFYVRWHDTAHTPTDAAAELGLIARQLRTTLALLEQLLAESPPEHGTPGLLAGQLRSWAHAYGQTAAHLYREAERLDTAAPVDHLVGSSNPPVCPTPNLTKPQRNRSEVRSFVLMLGRGSDAKKYAKLEEKFEQGKISYDELVEKSGKVLAKEQANCSHSTTAYDESTGTTWCANDSCGIRVS